MDTPENLPGGKIGDIRKGRANRVGEGDVPHDTVGEVRIGSEPGVIEKLVDDDDVPRTDFLPHASHGGEGEHPSRSDLLHGVDVGPEIDPGRRNPVPSSVAREKRECPSLEIPDDQRIGGVAERCSDLDAPDVHQSFHFVQPGTADHSEDVCHATPSSSLWCIGDTPCFLAERTRSVPARKECHSS
jgi:hypothetical protein